MITRIQKIHNLRDFWIYPMLTQWAEEKSAEEERGANGAASGGNETIGDVDLCNFLQ